VRAFPIEVENDGRLRLPAQVALPANARLAVLMVERAAESEEDCGSMEIARLAEQSGAVDFLKEEPNLYSDADIEPGQRNPDFAGTATSG
jgi:hypothetical protein